MNELPDFTSARMQREVSKLGTHLRKRNLKGMEKAALGCYLTAGVIGKNLSSGLIDENAAESMLQSAYQQMREIVFPDGDHRN